MKKKLAIYLLSLICVANMIGCVEGGASTSAESSTNNLPSSSTSSTGPVKVEIAELDASSLGIVKVKLSQALPDVTYQVYARENQNSNYFLIGDSFGKQEFDVSASRLTPGKDYEIAVTPIRNSMAYMQSKAVKIQAAGISIHPARATYGEATTFTLTGNGFENGMSFSFNGCVTSVEVNSNQTSSKFRQFKCTPTSYYSQPINGILSSYDGKKSGKFTVLSVESPPAKVDIAKLSFVKKTFEIASLPIKGFSAVAFPLLQCTKTEMTQRCVSWDVPETTCETSCTKNFFGWCQPNLPTCTTRMVTKQACTDLPVVYVADQTFNAKVDVNIPASDASSMNDALGDVLKIAETSVKSAIENHLKNTVDTLKKDEEKCVQDAAASALVTGAVSAIVAEGNAGAAATNATYVFINQFKTCTTKSIAQAKTNLMDMSKLGNTIVKQAEDGVEQYINSKIDANNIKLKFGSECGEYHPI